MKLSVCMIVRDEEKMLPNALNSLVAVHERLSHDGHKLETVIVDTGSKDRTFAVIERFIGEYPHMNVVVDDFEWCDDFSAARNFSLGKATGDWVFFFDADEEFEKGHIKELSQTLEDKDHDVVMISLLNAYKVDWGYRYTICPQSRMWRRDTGLKYKDIVHNQIDWLGKTWRVIRKDIRIIHYGYDGATIGVDRQEKKTAQRLALLRKQVKEEPHNAFAHLNLSQMLRSDGERFQPENAAEMIEHSSAALNLSPPNSERWPIHVQARHQLALIYASCYAHYDCIRNATEALRIKPDYLDCIFLIGYSFQSLGLFAQAKRWFELCEIVHDSYDTRLRADIVPIELYGAMPMFHNHIVTCEQQIAKLEAERAASD